PPRWHRGSQGADHAHALPERPPDGDAGSARRDHRSAGGAHGEAARARADAPPSLATGADGFRSRPLLSGEPSMRPSLALGLALAAPLFVLASPGCGSETGSGTTGTLPDA